MPRSIRPSSLPKPAPIRDRPESRRDGTRKKLVKAARKLFLVNNYFDVSIDEIVKEAGLSRATFYLHYPTRDAMIGDVVRHGLVGVDAFYRQLQGGPLPTKAQLREFIIYRVEATRKARRAIMLHYQAASYHPEIWPIILATRDRHMSILSETIPAFEIDAKAPTNARRQRSAAHLLLIQLEQIAHWATFAPELTDIEGQIDVLVDSFVDFIRTYS